jgi:phosphomannomutase
LRTADPDHDLIRSISGIRGTIGGAPGEGLTPLDVVRYTAAFGQLMKAANGSAKQPKVVMGRDARISGPMVADLVRGTLVGLGFEVIDLGWPPRPPWKWRWSASTPMPASSSPRATTPSNGTP